MKTTRSSSISFNKEAGVEIALSYVIANNEFVVTFTRPREEGEKKKGSDRKKLSDNVLRFKASLEENQAMKGIFAWLRVLAKEEELIKLSADEADGLANHILDELLALEAA